MGSEAFVPLSLEGSAGPGLCLAMGRRRVVNIGGNNGKRGGNRRVSPSTALQDADPWRDRRKQAVVGGELQADAGGVRAACRHDALSLWKPAIARRLRLVRPA